MKRKKQERGQALTELMAGLLGLCFITAGVFLIAMIGMAGIKTTIQARQDADDNTVRNQKNGSTKSISTWNDEDGILFSGDEQAVTSSELNGGRLTDELNASGQNVLAAGIDMQTPFQLNQLELFHSAANLTKGSRSSVDPLTQYKNFDSKRIFNAFGYSSDYTIKEDIAMPLLQ